MACFGLFEVRATVLERMARGERSCLGRVVGCLSGYAGPTRWGVTSDSSWKKTP